MVSIVDELWKEEPKAAEVKGLVFFVGLRNSSDPADWGYSVSLVSKVYQTFHKAMIQVLASCPCPNVVSILPEGLQVVMEIDTPERIRAVVRHFPDFFAQVEEINRKIDSRFALKLGIGAEWGTMIKMRNADQSASVYLGAPATNAYRHFSVSSKSYPLPRGESCSSRKSFWGRICASGSDPDSRISPISCSGRISPGPIYKIPPNIRPARMFFSMSSFLL